MNAQQLLHAHGIELIIDKPGQYYSTCPECSAKRKKAHQKRKVLGVLLKPNGQVTWRCNHCGWRRPPKGSNGARPELPTHVYHDGAGVLRFRKVRNLPGREPRFWLEQPDGKDGWKNGVKGVDTTILYRLDEIIKATKGGRIICIVEGEKDADNLWKLGIPATCNAHGAADPSHQKYTPKWWKCHSAQLKGAHIVVFNDNDAAGYAHAETTCKLSLGVAKRVRRLDLKPHWPEIEDGGDVSNWLEVGGAHTPERLYELIEAAPDYAAAPTGKHNGEAQTEADDAEEINDPLAGLVERAKADPSVPFAVETLHRLGVLQVEDRAGFEALRGKLKRVGVRVTVLDQAIAEQRGEAADRVQTQADQLIELAAAADIFHARDGTGFADVEVNGHRETWPIRSKGFRGWLVRCFYEATHGAPSSEALQSALNIIGAKARFDAPEREVSVRVARLDGRMYLDLADDYWRAVEIDATGWRVIERPPVHFRRPNGMLPLPVPVAGGSLAKFCLLLNVSSEADFILLIAWLLAALRDCGPYPVLVLSGGEGSAKSTVSKMLRALVDPNVAALRALPRDDRDLYIAATNSHILAFDNLSGLPVWISDTLCRLATGGGFAVRELYTDREEVLFDANRPVVLNSIEDVVNRPDLADRGLSLRLAAIPEQQRRPEQEIWAKFEIERPAILGALLTAVAHGLRELPNVHLDRLPRMADFAQWSIACETAVWPRGSFWRAYCGNQEEAVDGVIDSDPIAAAVRALMEARPEWSGTASQLLSALAQLVGEQERKSMAWPKSPRALSGSLRRAQTVLRKIGIDITFAKKGSRMIRIATSGETDDATKSRPSSPTRET
jgi:hypothetical protein